MFDHSIKVPRLYKSASKIAKSVSEGKGSIKQLVYEGKHPNIKALYALIVHTFQRTEEIDKLLAKSKLLVKEPRFEPWLAKILITELLWGKKRLSGQSKPVLTILAYEQIFKAHLSDVPDFSEEMQVNKPRYVRVNTLKISINEAVENFRDEGWILRRFPESDNYLGFLDAVKSLGPEEFMVDYHIPYLLIFPPKTEFYQHAAYKKSSIFLQDKASCLPVHILNPEPGSVVLDMCAAPGMKTTQLAAVMQDKGKIYAVEIGAKRHTILEKMIESSGAACIEAVNKDCLTLTGEHYPDVEYILVDPSCSGSGITDRVEIGQQELQNQKHRLEKLAGFQIKMLRHALTKFPKAKRVVYSTCSIYPEENEDVVRQVLETCSTFKLVPAVEFVNNVWHNFGSANFGSIGNKCLYAKPDIDLSSGFFVAVFERLAEGETNPDLNWKLFSRKFQTRGKDEGKKHKWKRDVVDMNIKEELEDVGKESEDAKELENHTEIQSKKKKRKRNEENNKESGMEAVREELKDVTEPEYTCEVQTKKKKKRKHSKEPEEVADEKNKKVDSVAYLEAEPSDKPKKKKKKKDKDILVEEDTNIFTNDGDEKCIKKKKKNGGADESATTEVVEKQEKKKKKSKKVDV